MLMTGKAKEYFDLWEVDQDTADIEKAYEDLLVKVNDYARRKKLDKSAQKQVQSGMTPWTSG